MQSPEASTSRLPHPSSTPRRTPSVKGKEKAVILETEALSVANGEIDVSVLPRHVVKRLKKKSASLDLDERGFQNFARDYLAKHPGLLAKAARKAKRQDEDEEDDGDLKEWKSCLVVEKASNTYPPVWTSDGRYYFVASGSTLEIHASVGPDYPHVSSLPSPSAVTDGHTGQIVSFALNPINPLQVLTASEDGFVKVWDWIDGRLIRSINIASAMTQEDVTREYKKAKKNKDSDKSNEREEKGRRIITQMSAGVVGNKGYLFVSTGFPMDHDSASRYHPHEVIQLPIRLNANEASSTNVRSSIHNVNRNLRKLGVLPRPPTTLAVSPKGTYLLATAGDEVYVRRLASTEHGNSWVRLPSRHQLTCAAWCPMDTTGGVSATLQNTDEEWFATGDEAGQILLWRGLTGAFETSASALVYGTKPEPSAFILHKLAEKTLPTTTYHWHAHPVGAIAFTSSGAQLLSVGEENVLVIWHLDTGKKSFMARLAMGGLYSLGVKSAMAGQGIEEEYWIGARDGTTVKISSSSGKTTTIGKTARLDPLARNAVKENRRYPLAYHSPTSSMVLPSSQPSIIQFYQPTTQKVLFDLEISPSNRVRGVGKADAVEQVRTDMIVFSDVAKNGTVPWMATSESREGDADEGGGHVRSIKIWEWRNGTYILNTHFAKAHGASAVSSMVFREPAVTIGAPSAGSSTAKKPEMILLTTADDGSAKVWTIKRGVVDTLQSGPGKSRKSSVEAFWALRSSFNYQHLPIFSSDISVDGSLIALAQGSVVTLWETSTNVLLRVFDTADIDGVRKVQFLGSEGRWLAFAGQNKGVGVWDLLSCEAAWTLPFFPQHEIIALSMGGTPYFLASSLTAGPSPNQQTIITCFGPSASKPIFRRAIPARLLQVCISGINTSHSVDASSVELTAISKDGRTLRVGEDVKPFPKQIQSVSVSATSSSAQGTQVKATNLSIWEEMFGKNTFSSTGATEIDDAVSNAIPGTVSKPIKDKRSKYSKVYDGPSTALPPMALLFDEFLNDFMDVKPVLPSSLEPESSTVRFAGDNKGDNSVSINMETASVISSEDPVSQIDMSIKKVGMQDVKELSDWFKNVVLIGSTPTESSKPKATPKAKMNGTTTFAATNHATPRSASQAKTAKGTPNAAKNAIAAESPVSTGKKRKVVPS